MSKLLDFVEFVEKLEPEKYKELQEVNNFNDIKAIVGDNKFDLLVKNFAIINKLDPDFINDPLEELRNEKLREMYFKIKEVLEYYCDMSEENYVLVSLWILGTHFHKQFNTYPYLFFNAPKGSGKTRLLKIIAQLSHNGLLLVSLNESVLFRLAKDSTFCIDEFERVNSKDKSALKELLNVGYKKGLSVLRNRKVNNPMGREKYEIEKFEAYCPVAMANIWGMDEVWEIGA